MIHEKDRNVILMVIVAEKGFSFSIDIQISVRASLMKEEDGLEFYALHGRAFVDELAMSSPKSK